MPNPSHAAPGRLMRLNKSKAFAVQRGKCPESDADCEFRISTQKILWCHKSAPEHVFYNLRNVPFAVNNPHAIFKGLEREGHENSYCYVARPERRFVSDTESVPVDDGWVFVLFITSALEIFSWRFEKSDQNNNMLPEN